ncbi:rod-binding protein [Ghiorsea bivora]|uniref:rod-binding protein n=1 Tax=Ghiorsea bivora TaxID=1485545 RepID=UPI00068BD49F|nr:rod-binding protein [Ghiorsea bivora]
MRDLVETVIGQVMKKQPTMKAAAQPTKNLVSLKGVHINPKTEIKDQELWKVSRQFEAIFLQQMMSAMRKTIPESELLPRGYADDMYEGMMDQAIAESGSKQAPLGLAMSIYRQLERDEQAQGTPSIQDIQKATDSIKKMNVVDNPTLGGI